MTDREFDQLLYQSAEQRPPDDGLLVTPWRDAMARICWGLALTTITLNHLYLQYILPTVGAILLLLGFRTLRRENRWFRLGYALSIPLAAERFAVDLLLATPWMSQISDGLELALGLVVMLAAWLRLFALWRGLIAVFRKAGQAPKTSAAGGLVIWDGIAMALALVNAAGMWLLLYLILFVVILISLALVSESMDQAGYAIEPAPVRWSNGRITALSLAALLAAVLACLLLFSRYPVDAAPAQAEAGQAELRAELLELGFPEDLLADLTDEEVAQMEGAVEVSNGSHVYSQMAPSNAVDIDSLSSQLIQVALPDGAARYFYYFSWNTAPDPRLTEGIAIMPSERYIDTQGHTIFPFLHISQPQGRLLWKADGQLLQSPLTCDGLTPITYQSFFGTVDFKYYEFIFSLPRKGEHIRGYLTWTLEGFETTINLTPRVFYTRQTSLLHYPWQTPWQAYWNHAKTTHTLIEDHYFTYTVSED